MTRDAVGIVLGAFPTLNWIAILLAAIVAVILSAIVLAPPVLGNRFMTLLSAFLGKKKEELQPRASQMIVGFITALVAAIVLAIVLGYTTATTTKTAWDGVQVGFWIWLASAAMTYAGYGRIEKRPISLFAINTAFFLVALLVMGAIIGAFG